MLRGKRPQESSAGSHRDRLEQGREKRASVKPSSSLFAGTGSATRRRIGVTFAGSMKPSIDQPSSGETGSGSAHSCPHRS
jgi:hypothetical protein